MKYINKKNGILLCTLFLINGCASTNQKNQSIYPTYHGKQPVFAVLDKSKSGKFIISSVLSSRYGQGNIVRLNDLRPMWRTKTERDCFMGTGITGQDRAKVNCKTYAPEKFRIDSMDVAQVLGKGLLTIASYGMHGTARRTNIVFDESAYIAAIQEALKNSSINRLKIINTVDSIKKIQDEKLARYNKLVSTLSITPKINDMSGLYTEGSDYFNQYIHIKRIKNALSFKIDSHDVNKIHDILTEKTNTDFDEQLVTLSLDCSEYDKTYNFKIDCSDDINLNDGTINVKPVVTVLSKNIDKLLPKYFYGKDDNLKVSILGSNVTIQNQSNDFISVQSASIYYKNKINTRAVALELPPKSNYNLSLNEFLYNLPPAKRAKYTMNSAKAEHVDFGIALKYEITNRNKSKTLFEHKEFLGKDLL